MKANEAPKKLYLLPNGLISYCRNTDEDIEYTRTDAFIEKACEWLKNHNDYIDVKDGNVTYFDMRKCVVDFRKAMKGGEEWQNTES